MRINYFSNLLDASLRENSWARTSKTKLNYFNNVIAPPQYSLTFVCIISWTLSRLKVPRKRESQDMHVQNNNYLMQSSLALSGFLYYKRRVEDNGKRFLLNAVKDLFINSFYRKRTELLSLAFCLHSQSQTFTLSP